MLVRRISREGVSSVYRCSIAGKTCLLTRFSDEIFFSGKFFSTVGIDHRNKLVTLGEKKINLQIYDTVIDLLLLECLSIFFDSLQVGQERFRSLTHSYYRDADALLLLYDITSYSSFDNISSWLSQIKEIITEPKIIMLIGNKIDKSQRVVSRESAEHLAQRYQINFLETSAKTGQNVELAFMTTAQDLMDKNYLRRMNQFLSKPSKTSCC